MTICDYGYVEGFLYCEDSGWWLQVLSFRHPASARFSLATPTARYQFFWTKVMKLGDRTGIVQLRHLLCSKGTRILELLPGLHQADMQSSDSSAFYDCQESFPWQSHVCGYDVAADKWCMLGLCQSARRQKSSGFTTTPAWQQSPPLVKYVLEFAHLVNLPFVNCVGLPRQLTKAVTSPGSAELALVKHTISMHVTHHFDHCVLN